MKQIVSNYTYSPAANCVTLTGLNIDQDQLLLVVAPEQGRTLYNFASVTGSVIPGSNTRINLSASTAGLTTSSPLVIFYEDQLSTQTIAGAVTANLTSTNLNGVTIGVRGTVTASGLVNAIGADNLTQVLGFPIVFNDAIAEQPEFRQINVANPLPVRAILTTVTVGNSVTIGSLPAINGTVTANLSSVPTHGVTISNSSVTVNGTFYQATQPVSITSLPASTVTVSSLPAISGTVTANAFGADNSGNPVRIPVGESSAGSLINYGVPIVWNDTEAGPDTRVAGDAYPLPVRVSSGTVTANVASLPKVTLIDGSGSVDTADSAIEVFATTTTRSYLLVQVTTGSAYVNVGATATTANGIYLASGQGYAWETTIPQGVCSLISSVTGTAYCAKQS